MDRETIKLLTRCYSIIVRLAIQAGLPHPALPAAQEKRIELMREASDMIDELEDIFENNPHPTENEE